MAVLDPTLPSQLTAEMIKFTPSLGSCLVLTHVHGILKGQDVGHDTNMLAAVML